MSFAMQSTDISTEEQLRHLEPQAPKHMKGLMTQAADDLRDYRRRFERWALELELAASLKVGCMDSQSRVEDVQRQIALTITGIAAEMRELL